MRTLAQLPFVLFILFISVTFTILSTSKTYAHSGRTDANGGHNCYVGACAGTYHYHNGGSYTAPSSPNYVELGRTNGAAHAQKEAESIRSRTTSSGYQAGYAAGIAGETQSYYVSPPASVCDITFTFEEGTDETYKTWYKTGWLSECDAIARTVYQAGYNQGFAAGAAAKPQPVTQTGSLAKNSSNGDWIIWAVVGGFIGLPIIAGLRSKAKE